MEGEGKYCFIFLKKKVFCSALIHCAKKKVFSFNPFYHTADFLLTYTTYILLKECLNLSKFQDSYQNN